MTQNKSEITNKHNDINQITNKLAWEDETVPRSVQFDDTYYSKADGLSETKYVFIQGNKLPEQWRNIQNCTIGELGFGTGLNFLVTAQEWQIFHKDDTNSKNAKLHFISFEQFPITAAQMRKALSRWPHIKKAAECLAEAWDDALDKQENIANGPVTIEYAKNILLTVYMGDANILLPTLQTKIDAWYLDGFSPAKNPELWNKDLMMQVAKTTNLGGTFATYTAASFVRQNLKTAGFIVERIKGHAGKQHMSVGYMPH